MKLSSTGERDSIISFWGEEVPYFPIWERVYTVHRPQAINHNTGSKERSPSFSSCKTPNVILAAYRYTIQYKPTREHGNADGLFRLPVHTGEVIESEAAIFNVKQIEVFASVSCRSKERDTKGPHSIKSASLY